MLTLKEARERLALSGAPGGHEVLAALDSAVAEVAKLTGCRCEALDASEGGGTDERSCPEHAYEVGRRHERSVYLDERTKLAAVSESALADAQRQLVYWKGETDRLEGRYSKINARLTAERDRAVALLRGEEQLQALIVRGREFIAECVAKGGAK